MSEPLLTVLKFCLLAVIYLFFWRVLRAVWMEMRSPEWAVAGAGASGGATVTESPPTPTPGPQPTAPALPTRAVVLQPAESVGDVHTIGEELTLGRSSGCGVVITDDFVSQLHARIARRAHQLVVEDLGSTNGTFVNGHRLDEAVAVTRGDQVQVGNTLMELQ